MKLTYFRGDDPNFGDELNTIIWNELLPSNFLDKCENDLFVGIGSIIWDNYPKMAVKHVIGSGYGGYTATPDIHDGSWNVVWVRGPQTAAKLGLDPALAITDSAILLRATKLPAPEPKVGVAFMPHFQSIKRGNWAKVCECAGMTFLDPRDDPQRLLAKIQGADLVITEAMHGAIVADALRTPFIPVLPMHPSHHAKWSDWAQSIELNLELTKFRPSTMLELYVQRTGRNGSSRKSRFLLQGPHAPFVNSMFTELAVANLRNIAKNSRPYLSADATIDRLTNRCLDALNLFIQCRAH